MSPTQAPTNSYFVSDLYRFERSSLWSTALRQVSKRVLNGEFWRPHHRCEWLRFQKAFNESLQWKLLLYHCASNDVITFLPTSVLYSGILLQR